MRVISNFEIRNHAHALSEEKQSIQNSRDVSCKMIEFRALDRRNKTTRASSYVGLMRTPCQPQPIFKQALYIRSGFSERMERFHHTCRRG